MSTISAVLYANQNHPELKIEYPHWPDRYKQIMKKWRALSADKKQPYLQRARDNRSAQQAQQRTKKAQQVRVQSYFKTHHPTEFSRKDEKHFVQNHTFISRYYFANFHIIHDHISYANIFFTFLSLSFVNDIYMCMKKMYTSIRSSSSHSMYFFVYRLKEGKICHVICHTNQKSTLMWSSQIHFTIILYNLFFIQSFIFVPSFHNYLFYVYVFKYLLPLNEYILHIYTHKNSFFLSLSVSPPSPLTLSLSFAYIYYEN